MPEPIVIKPEPIERPRYVVHRLSDRALQGGAGELIRPEAIPPELYQALERALDGKPWRQPLVAALQKEPSS